MDFLIDNPLAKLYGPYFLVLYAIFIISIPILLAIVKRRIDSSHRLTVPNIPSEIDPFEIAYLRGDKQELARSVIFGLIKKEYIEFSETKDKILRRDSNPMGRLSNIEQISLEWLGKERAANEVFAANGLVVQLGAYASNYEQKLGNQQLLIDRDTKRKYSVFKITMMLSIVALGFYKVLAAIANGKTNVTFIFVFGFFGVAIVWLLSDLPRVSKLGQKYLASLQIAFENLKTETQKSYSSSGQETATPAVYAGVDPMLLSVGVFGASVLGGTIYDQYNEVFKKSIPLNSSCGSDCGSCADDSSGCSSGSSCSSCSSCGGGCGGCGGD